MEGGAGQNEGPVAPDWGLPGFRPTLASRFRSVVPQIRNPWPEAVASQVVGPHWYPNGVLVDFLMRRPFPEIVPSKGVASIRLQGLGGLPFKSETRGPRLQPPRVQGPSGVPRAVKRMCR